MTLKLLWGMREQTPGPEAQARFGHAARHWSGRAVNFENVHAQSSFALMLTCLREAHLGLFFFFFVYGHASRPFVAHGPREA